MAHERHAVDAESEREAAPLLGVEAARLLEAARQAPPEAVLTSLINDLDTHAKETVLVTTDRELKSFAKEKGIRTINSIEFYFILKKAFVSQGKKEETLKRVNTRVSQNEVEQWLKIFNSE